MHIHCNDFKCSWHKLLLHSLFITLFNTLFLLLLSIYLKGANNKLLFICLNLVVLSVIGFVYQYQFTTSLMSFFMLQKHWKCQLSSGVTKCPYRNSIKYYAL